MLDADHFSQVNNKHGHDTGDDVLKTIAKHISAVTEGGKAYRYRGEEFAIVFPNLEADVAVRASGEKPEEVMKRANELLYQAKEDGRNRVYCEAEEADE